MRAGVFLGGCFAFVFGVTAYGGCGGRLLVAECKPGWQFCSKAVVCCPAYTTVCGTGEPNDAGYTCPLGSCCPPFDGGGAPSLQSDPWPESEPVPQVTENPPGTPMPAATIIPTHPE